MFRIVPHVVPPLQWTTLPSNVLRRNGTFHVPVQQPPQPLQDDSPLAGTTGSTAHVSNALMTNCLASQLENLPLLLMENEDATTATATSSTPRLDLPPPTHLSDILRDDDGKSNGSGGNGNDFVFSLSDFVVTPSLGLEDAAASGRCDGEQRPKELTVEQRQSLRTKGQLQVPSRRYVNQHHTWQIRPSVYSGTNTIVDDWKLGTGVALDQLLYSTDALFLVDNRKGESDGGLGNEDFHYNGRDDASLLLLPRQRDHHRRLHKSATAVSNQAPSWESLGRAGRSIGSAVRTVRQGLTQWTARSATRRRKYNDYAIRHLVHEARESYIRYHFDENRDGDNGSDDKGSTCSTSPTTAINSNSINGSCMHEPTGVVPPLLFFQDKHNRYYQRDSDNLVDDLWQALLDDGQWTITNNNKPTNEEIRDAHQAMLHLQQLREAFVSRRRNQQRDDASNREVAAATTAAEAAARMSPRAAKIFQQEQNQLDQATTAASWIQTVAESGRTSTTMGPYGIYESERLLALQIKLDMQEQDWVQAEQQCAAFEETRQKKGGIRSWSTQWQRRQYAKRLALECNALQATFTQRWIEQLRQRGLHRMARIETLRLEFDSQHQSQLTERLRSIFVPLPPQVFSVLQWDPNHWRVEHGVVVRHKEIKVSLDRPWWRLEHCFMRFWAATKEIAGGSVHFLLNGPLSFRALLGGQTPFYAVERPQRDETSLTQTLASRLHRFWSALADVRRKFEAEPDTGLIGKSLSRFFLRIHLVTKSILGTAWIVAFMTVGTVLSTTMAATLLVVGPVIGLSWALMVLAFTTLFYDVSLAVAWGRPCKDGLHRYFQDWNNESGQSFSSPIVKIALVAPLRLLGAALQTAGALMMGTVVHPVIAVVRFTWATIRAGLRTGRDGWTWLLLRRAVRVPATAHDTWLAKRIHGPGLASIQYFRLPLWAAKLAVLLHLDSIRLQLHDRLRRKELGQYPYDAYTSIFAMEQYGMRVSPMVQSPIHAAQQLAHDMCSEIDPAIVFGRMEKAIDFQEDVWDRAAHTLRAHHPDYIENQWDVARRGASSRKYASVASFEAKVVSVLSQKADRKRTTPGPSSPLQVLVDSITPTLAIWIAQTEYRQAWLRECVAIPREVSGMFRLAEDELRDLWEFTLNEVEIYDKTIQTEVEQISSESQWLTKSDGEQASRSFLGKDDSSAIRAFTLLQSLFGEESLTTTMEEVDETLVLSARMEPEDRHLYVWMETSSTSDVDHIIDRAARQSEWDEKKIGL